MGAGRRHETAGVETQDLIARSTGASRSRQLLRLPASELTGASQAVGEQAVGLVTA